MKAIKINNEWQKFAKIPSTFNGVNGYQYDTSRHYNDGWRDFVSPVYNAETETHTQTIIEQGTDPNKTATYEVRDLTQEELDQRAEDAIPVTLTRSQLRQSLLLNGILEVDILNAINTLPSPQKELILIKWEDEQTFTRTSQDVQDIKEIMQLTTEQLNNIFIQGVEL
jgi:hypothetical protein